eukprot:1166308-Ditylum_brightwellii.AAC.1
MALLQHCPSIAHLRLRHGSHIQSGRQVQQTAPSIYTHHTHACTANLLIGRSIHPLLLHTVHNDKKENNNDTNICNRIHQALIRYPSWTRQHCKITKKQKLENNIYLQNL